MNVGLLTCLSSGLLLSAVMFTDAAADIVVGDQSASCAEDPACINRLHPEIPMVAVADPGERIVFEPYSREIFETSQQWIAERDIFEGGDLGDRSYENAVVSVA